ncbi:hypothetical protein ACF0H5_011125 [Mactra antiquata]
MASKYIFNYFVFMFYSEGLSTGRSCPQWYTRHMGTCYLVSKFKSSWFSANKFCRQSNAHLVYVETVREHTILNSMLHSDTHDNHRYWLGGRGVFNGRFWSWTFGNKLITIDQWKTGEPSDEFIHNMHKNCLALKSSHGVWINELCFQEFFFVCEYDLDVTSGSNLVG